MAKHLTVKDVKAIVEHINSVEQAGLTWDAICDGVTLVIGKRPTRQSLCKHVAIASAYKSRKTNERTAATSLAKPASLAIAAQRIRRLESELAEQRERNRQLLEHFLIVQYNAYKHGVKEDQLLMPLPPIDRERTDSA
ncbi:MULTISPECIES: hypothetical protein [Pseudomonas syringae group]|uniref:Uncharacterized protein n=1 Tax=Pseudomonas savastanoi pv. savastanoi NCPPB 3335 TaxID=693985 RepID=A0ABC8BJH3_PSESS|nr:MULTISPECIES: hypothetical protein [Pseudomonas syringae group]ARD14211.1 hypothetical protein PSA3335_26055 [Pseudomonas savastanoi pv. savastanoi NCPPB 3335]KPY45958.1 hypothetical protein ALO49_200250 [Pseudomonas savastanoi pv. retacarpa]KTC55828.1 hypothetical protein AO258_20975 [Pseudomonas syringae ICMP 19498]MBA4703771.1 hypothetical protein [Pseudomonas savastanoi pv. savastanoi]MBN3470241.1 hypothetical protein [Pseudomonas savastanoi pv. phaseolicola]